MMKQMSYHVNTWGIWVKGIQEFFAVFPKLLCKSDFKIKWKKKKTTKTGGQFGISWVSLKIAVSHLDRALEGPISLFLPY